MTEPGNEIEFAIWYDANEHLDPINSCSESIKDALDAICAKKNVGHGEISYAILKPGDDRVPLVPRWLEIINGVIPRLLLATTKTTSSLHKEPIGIVGDLDKKDIGRLRAITRRAHRKAHPKTMPLTNQECDRIIDQIGMEVVMDQLRSTVVH